MLLLPVQIAFYLLLGIALFDGFALIVLLLPFSETDLELGVALFIEEDAERDDSETFFLDLVLQLAELPFGQQEFAVVHRQVVVGGPEAIFGDMHVADP